MSVRTRIGSRMLVGLLVWPLAGCGERPGTEPVTVEFWALGREGEVVRRLLPEFERRNPGIRVEVQQIPWRAAHEKLLTAYVGDATPDLAQLGNTWIPELVALDALTALDPWLERSSAIAEDDYFVGIWKTNRIDGRSYGIPWYVDTRLLFYRKDLLAEAGVPEPPGTWAEWRDAMRRVKAEVGPDRYAAFLPLDEWQAPVILALQRGSTLLRDGGRYGAFRDSRFREAFAFYVDLFREGLAPVLDHNQLGNVYQEFARGYFAMYVTGPWNIGEFRRRLPEAVRDEWMTAPLPAPDGAAPGVSVAGGSSLVIFESARHKAAAWKLIEYLSTPARQARFHELTGDLPARKSAWRTSSLAGDRHAPAFWRQLQRVEPTPKVPEWERIADKVRAYAEAAVRGEMTTTDALAALDRDVDRILEKRRWMLARETTVAEP